MHSPGLFIAVGVGGAVGAMMRYGIAQIPQTASSLFPFATLIVNVLGAFIIGFIAGMVSRPAHVSPMATAFWKAGFCGGLTTFSTFSLEAVSLFEKGHGIIGSAYIALSIFLTLAGVVLGRMLALYVFKSAS